MNFNPTLSQKPVEVANYLRTKTEIIKTSLLYSFILGVLSLGPTIFMLEVYDRVVNSRNVNTLLMLLLLVIGSYVVMEMLELVRQKHLHDAAHEFDLNFRDRLFSISFEANIKRMPGGTMQSFYDLKTLREFIHSGAVIAMLDAPMALVFLILVFILSPWLGVLALIGAMVQVFIAYQTEQKTMPVLTEANKGAIDAQNYANGTLRNVQVIEAMGMMGNIHQRWMSKQRKFLQLQADASDTAGTNNAYSKLIQTLQSSLLLGAACWLTLKGQMLGGGGMMIVASTLGGKVLTPLVQLVAQWRSVVNARDAYNRLESVIGFYPEKPISMPLPAPKGLLSVEQVLANAPNSAMAILRGVSFSLSPGECLMLIGPSASGKTTLARLIMGLWPAYSGKVRLDGVDVFNWDKNQLGPYLGYLPQTVELFDGTVAENVARFGVVDIKEVERVIEQVGLMDLINSLPDGLSTRIGEDGSILSGGQRQRVALARAIYGQPKLIVLDEPNSNLDEAGEVALLSTLANLKKQGASVLVITHRTSVLPQADKLLMLREGQVFLFGPRDEVLAALQKAQNENLQNQPHQVSKPSVTQVQKPPAGVASQNNSSQSGAASKAKTMTVSAVPMGMGVSVPKAAAIAKASSEGDSK